VVILGRNPDRVRVAVEAIRRQAVGANVTSISLDLADLESVTSAAAALTRLDRLDALIQNAGVAAARHERRTTRQGFELAMGTNHLGHFALTALAMPILSATPGSRVVPIGSILTKVMRFNLDDLQSKRSYKPWKAYAQSKHAVQMFGFELDRRLRAADADSHSIAAHPGGCVGTPVVVRPPQVSKDPQLAARLWALSEELTGVDFLVPAGQA